MLLPLICLVGPNILALASPLPLQLPSAKVSHLFSPQRQAVRRSPATYIAALGQRELREGGVVAAAIQPASSQMPFRTYMIERPHHHLRLAPTPPGLAQTKASQWGQEIEGHDRCQGSLLAL